MDVSFAVGQEFKVTRSSYIGLRVGYDLNVLDFFDDEKMGISSGDLYMDSLNFNITYRYAFSI